jgi:glucose-6-phosphate dehydrogenase assembly protein OpcA
VRARVSAHCNRGPAGTAVCSEQVTLEVDAGDVELVPGSVRQLLVEDLPVATVWRRPDWVGDPLFAALLEMSDRMIVGATRSADPAAWLAELERLTAPSDRPRRVLDLAWARLEPWREAVAALFDSPEARRALDDVQRLVVTGPALPAAYAAGWVASRLGFRGAPGAWRRADGGRVEILLKTEGTGSLDALRSVRVEARHDGAAVAYGAERVAATLVRLSAECPDAPARSRVFPLPSRDDVALVCGLLQRSERHVIFERALAVAARLAAGGGGPR